MSKEEISNKDKRKRMNIILEVCKFRKNKAAMQCFDDDCKDVKETEIVSKKFRRRGDGTMNPIETKTGNILVSCETHGWSELFSTSQLDNIPMPERTTSVSDSVPDLSNPE